MWLFFCSWLFFGVEQQMSNVDFVFEYVVHIAWDLMIYGVSVDVY